MSDQRKTNKFSRGNRLYAALLTTSGGAVLMLDKSRRQAERRAAKQAAKMKAEKMKPKTEILTFQETSGTALKLKSRKQENLNPEPIRKRPKTEG